MTAVLLRRQVRLEQQAFWRNPQAAFFTFAMPICLLVVLGAVNGSDKIPGRHISIITLFVPGIVAFGVVAAMYANLASTVATLRGEGVLKRVRATPLPPAAYLAGHLGAALVTGALLAGSTVLLGWAIFGVAPHGVTGVVELTVSLIVGAACFAALGLALSAWIPSADAAAPITNATYLPLAIVSGLFYPLQNLPKWLDTIVGLFPIKALAVALQAGFDPAHSGIEVGNIAVLAAWGIGGGLLAWRFFRWQP